jgi:hypothetical protein
MSKDEAARLHQLLLRIESGQVDLGVTALRALLHDAGHPAPPFIVPARERQPQGKER